MTNTNKEHTEKRVVAIGSVYAALFLTSFKIIVGIFTGSLGILSEALHSGLDMIAAMMTFFAVKISEKPADDDHHFGHGKVENFSALLETFLLLLTCVWIIYESIDRLSTGQTHIINSVWSYIVVISSVLIDITRSRALMRVAKKYNSQALEADALHFSTDIFSSLVVLVGLIGASFNYFFADSLSALFVALIVFIVALRLGKRSVDALLDKSPTNVTSDFIKSLIKDIPGVTNVHSIKIRPSGPDTFINLNIHVLASLTIKEAHDLAHQVENKINDTIRRSQVHVHTEPENTSNEGLI